MLYRKNKIGKYDQQLLKQTIDSALEMSQSIRSQHSINQKSLKNELLNREASLLVFMPHYTDTKKRIRNDLEVNMFQSAKSLDLKVFRLCAYGSTYRRGTEYSLNKVIEELKKIIVKEQINYLIIDVNYLPYDNDVNIDNIRYLKNKYKLKIIGNKGDNYAEAHSLSLQYWLDVIDIVVLFNIQGNCLETKNLDKILYVPTFCFVSSHSNIVSHKNIDLWFHGKVKPGRKKYVRKFKKLSIKSDINLFVDSEKALNSKQYYESMANAKIAFNNGVFSNNIKPKRIITGKIAEAISSKTLLLYESPSHIDDFLIPYSHYIPVSTPKEASMLIDFFIRNDDYRQKIVQESFLYWNHFYNPASMWHELFERLDD